MLNAKLLKLLCLAFGNTNRAEARAALLRAKHTAADDGSIAIARMLEVAVQCPDPDAILASLIPCILAPPETPDPQPVVTAPPRQTHFEVLCNDLPKAVEHPFARYGWQAGRSERIGDGASVTYWIKPGGIA